MLAQNEFFGARAPVGSQRLFHLGRELKSGGRSLYNLGLGRFNNRIIHLVVRPGSEKSSIDRSTSETTAGSRKRSREASSQQQPDRRPLSRTNPSETIDIYNEPIQPIAIRPAPSANNPSNTLGSNSSIAIDLVDSSDDDDDNRIDPPGIQSNSHSSATTRPVASTNNPSHTLGSNSSIAIDLVDSSDDDEEEV